MPSDDDNASTYCDSVTCPVFHRRLNLFSDDKYKCVGFGRWIGDIYFLFIFTSINMLHHSKINNKSSHKYTYTGKSGQHEAWVRKEVLKASTRRRSGTNDVAIISTLYFCGTTKVG